MKNLKKERKERQSGFTILELLVVIAVVGLIASIINVAASTARAKARDARRIADLRQLVTAQNLFYSQYEKYVCGSTDFCAPGASGYECDLSDNIDFMNGRPSVFPWECLTQPPWGLKTAGIVGGTIKDPLNANGYFYYYEVLQPDYQTYVFSTRLESNVKAGQNDGGVCQNFYEVGPGVGVMSLYMAPFFTGVSCN